MLTRLGLWIRSNLLRRQLERDMQREMAEHLERSTARLVARGMSARDARAEARREFGNVTSLQEQARAERGWRWLYTITGDLRFAMRHYGKRPATTLTIVFVLATGLSISTALFSFMLSYSTEPPPGITRAADMVRLRGMVRSGGENVARPFTLDEFRAQQALADHFRQTAAWIDHNAFLGAGGDPERRTERGSATFVSEDYFSVLGVRPAIGALLAPRDFGTDAPLAAVLSHGAWKQLFGARADIVGRTVVVDGALATIVGVMPPRFSGVSTFDPIKIWLPLTAQSRIVPSVPRDAPLLRTAARLAPGVTLQQATAATMLVASRVSANAASLTPATRGSRTSRETALTDVVPLIAASGDPSFERDVRVMTACFTALGILVLLVTCTNVSALIAGLGIARRKEVAIRLSMGAARARIVRQLVTESVLLAVAAGPIALGVIWSMQRALTLFAPDIPITMRVSWPATLFTFGLALLVGMAFGVSPALHATRLSVASVLKESASMITASGTRMQRGLVVAQIAFTQPLVVGIAALLLIVFGAYQRQGFTPAADQIVSLKVRMPREASASALPPAQRAARVARLQGDSRRLRERLERTAGVVRVVPDVQGVTRLAAYGVHPADRVAGGNTSLIRMSAMRASPGFLDVMSIPIIAGSDFSGADTMRVASDGSEMAVIIGDALARELWPGVNPIGRRLVPLAEDLDAPETVRPPLVVRGVAEQNDDDPSAAHEGHRVTIPVRNDSTGALSFVMRTTGSAGPMMPTLRRVVAEEMPNVASIDARTLKDLQAEVRNAYTLVTMTLVVGGGLALLVAAIGLYAVVSLAVGQRTGEIGVRMAVGARASQIAGRFMRDGLRLGAIGLAIGLPLSLLGLRVLLSMPELLPPVGIGVVGVLAGAGVMLVAVLATVIPARRAAAVDPAIVLRGE